MHSSHSLVSWGKHLFLSLRMIDNSLYKPLLFCPLESFCLEEQFNDASFDRCRYNSSFFFQCIHKHPHVHFQDSKVAFTLLLHLISSWYQKVCLMDLCKSYLFCLEEQSPFNYASFDRCRYWFFANIFTNSHIFKTVGWLSHFFILISSKLTGVLHHFGQPLLSLDS